MRNLLALLAMIAGGGVTMLLLGILLGGPSSSSSSAAAAVAVVAPPPTSAAPAPPFVLPAAESSYDGAEDSATGDLQGVGGGGGGGGGGDVDADVAAGGGADDAADFASDYGSRILRWKRWNAAEVARRRRRRRRRLDDESNDGERRRMRLPPRRRRGDLRRLVSELEMQSPIYATMRRSLKEKRHVTWQREQDDARVLLLLLPPLLEEEEEGRRRYNEPADDEEERAGGGGGSTSFSSSFIPSSSTSSSFFHPPSSSSSSSSSSPPPRPPPQLLRRRVLTSDSHRHHRPRRRRRRRIEDEFADAYSTGMPGSTYGYNMFCGISWAEASTSCPSRQNCPSGQSDECLMPGHECWAFTECDTRNGEDGLQFSETHGVSGAENLAAVGVGAVASGGYVDLDKPSYNETDHSFCGMGYEDAVSRCATHCPSGNLNDCPPGEICFTKTPCDARMLTRAPQPPGPTMSPTTPSPVVSSSKLNKYFCGYDWKDAQER